MTTPNDALLDRIAQLPEHKREELATLMGELSRRKRQRKLFEMYPDKGAHRRELYPKHMEFMACGADHKERCFLAGNRCISPWTWVDTKDRTTGLAHEVFGDSDQCVVAWDGEREETMPVGGLTLRKLAPAYRVVLDNGQFFDCCHKHRLLTTEGWVSLGQLAFPSGGRRYTHKVQDYQANCEKDGYLCGPQLLAGLSIGQVQAPARSDAREFDLIWSRKDALERTRGYMRACLQRDLDPTEGDQIRLAGLYGQFLGPAMPHSVLPRTWKRRDGQRYQPGSFLSREVVSVGQRLEDRPLRLDDLSPYGSCTSPVSLDELTIAELLQHTLSSESGSADEPTHCDVQTISVFEPFEHTPLVGGCKIQAIVPIGYQPIIDTTIDTYHNYRAGGVYHHNTGKTIAGSFETTCHITGRYPDWWTGRRFKKPVNFWAAGDTAKTVRDIIQVELLGIAGEHGTGMIPGGDIIRTTPKAGVPDAVDTIYVKHHNARGEEDGISQLGLKSYDQGRIAFQGTAQDGIWLDEECPMDVYMECLVRTMTTKGLIYLTFTPLKGLTDVVLLFMPKGEAPD